MSRPPDTWERMTSFENLRLAARRAAKGKRDRPAVARFLEAREPLLLALQRQLIEGRYEPGAPCVFTIRDPKERVISAAPFRDRVVHHAAMAVLAPLFERRMVYESFACREGKGTRAALDHAQRELRHYGYFLKLDIHHCFESIEHGVALEAVARTVRHPRVLALVGRLAAGGGPGARGLPIGALTSQWLANLVLDRLDHFCKEDLRVPGYVRYMDDFVLFHDSREQLKEWHGAVREFVMDALRLRLKERATVLAPHGQGLPFLGFRTYRRLRRVRPENLRRTRMRLKRRKRELEQGLIDEDTYAASVRSVVEHLRAGQTRGLRRDWFAGPQRAGREGRGSRPPPTA